MKSTKFIFVLILSVFTSINLFAQSSPNRLSLGLYYNNLAYSVPDQFGIGNSGIGLAAKYNINSYFAAELFGNYNLVNLHFASEDNMLIYGLRGHANFAPWSTSIPKIKAGIGNLSLLTNSTEFESIETNSLFWTSGIAFEFFASDNFSIEFELNYNGALGDTDILPQSEFFSSGVGFVWYLTGKNDYDGDGLTKKEEEEYNSNHRKFDTDEDVLNDFDEYEIKTDPNNPDTDEDGLEDGEELKYKADPNLKDSDDDGLFDGEEVKIYKTKPDNPDSDNDKMSDYKEVNDPKYGIKNKNLLVALDPNNPDTDGDGLLDGEDDNPLEYNKDKDNDGIADSLEVSKYNTDPTLKDTDEDGLSDGDEINKHKTNPLVKDSDNDGLSDGDEVITYATNPRIKDTDVDRLSDGDEVNNYETNPNNPDSDNDGLSDGDEVLMYKTNPLNPDSDGDSAYDKDEIDNGSDPNNPNSKPGKYGKSITFKHSFNEGLGGDGRIEPNSNYNSQIFIEFMEKFGTDIEVKDNLILITGSYSSNTIDGKPGKQFFTPPSELLDEFDEPIHNTNSYLAITSIGAFPNSEISQVMLGVSKYPSEGKSICIDNSNNIYYSGIFENSIILGNQVKVNGTPNNKNSFIVKIEYDSIFYSTKIQWDISFGKGGTGEIYDMCIGLDSCLYVVGTYRNNITLKAEGSDIQLSSREKNELFYGKINQNTGKFIWAKSASSKGEVVGSSIGALSSGEIIITGYFEETMFWGKEDDRKFKHKISGNGLKDIFLAQIEPQEGKALWVTYAGDEANDFTNSMAIDEDDNIFICGVINGEAIFYNKIESRKENIFVDKLPTQASEDIFIAAYSKDGKYLDGEVYRGRSNNSANDIAIKGRNLYLTGKLLGDVNFGNDVIAKSKLGPTGPYNSYLANIKYDISQEDNIFTTINVEVGGNNEITNGNKYPAIGKEIAIDKNSDIYLMGYSVGKIVFGADESHFVQSVYPVIFVTKFGLKND